MIVKTQFEQESISGKQYSALLRDAKKQLQSRGVEFIEFLAADAKWFVDLYYQKTWEDTIKICGDSAVKAKQMLGE